MIEMRREQHVTVSAEGCNIPSRCFSELRGKMKSNCGMGFMGLFMDLNAKDEKAINTLPAS